MEKKMVQAVYLFNGNGELKVAEFDTTGQADAYMDTLLERMPEELHVHLLRKTEVSSQDKEEIVVTFEESVKSVAGEGGDDVNAIRTWYGNAPVGDEETMLSWAHAYMNGVHRRIRWIEGTLRDDEKDYFAPLDATKEEFDRLIEDAVMNRLSQSSALLQEANARGIAQKPEVPPIRRKAAANNVVRAEFRNRGE